VVAARDGSTKVLKIQSYGKVDESGRIVVDHTIAQDISGEFEARTHINERLEKLLSVEAALSEREASALKSVIAGKPNKAIAKQFSITERAVEMIRSRLMKKFDVGTSAELIALASELETLRGVLQFND
jgi:FixJ family two-component response regulator